jgi:hypothetical protein
VTVRVAAGLLVALGGSGCASATLGGSSYEQAYLVDSHNWVFRREYPEADRLFNGFDYGHAIAYETLLRSAPAGPQRLDESVFEHVVGTVLRSPPRLPLEERAIGPTYVTLIPELEAMFSWAHMLHRQLYDIIADRRLTPNARDDRVRELLAYYRSRPDLAFSSTPKAMALMEGQAYSLTFRRASPKYNGLLWSYHWLQMATYDALLADDDPVARRRAVDGAVARFWMLVSDAPARLPRVMPMSAAVAPRFADRYPDAAIIFDNLHALHDVVADVLSSPHLSASERRRILLVAAAAYRDSTTAVTSREEWRAMSRAMGIERMGGQAVPPSRDP